MKTALFLARVGGEDAQINAPAGLQQVCFQMALLFGVGYTQSSIRSLTNIWMYHCTDEQYNDISKSVGTWHTTHPHQNSLIECSTCSLQLHATQH